MNDEQLKICCKITEMTFKIIETLLHEGRNIVARLYAISASLSSVDFYVSLAHYALSTKSVRP